MGGNPKRPETTALDARSEHLHLTKKSNLRLRAHLCPQLSYRFSGLCKQVMVRNPRKVGSTSAATFSRLWLIGLIGSFGGLGFRETAKA